MMEQEHFIVNTRVKDILGRELINNDNIAIIELIKNAKDAASCMVDVSFENPESLEKGVIKIKDFGHGMTYDDIVKKWLNMGFSVKRAAIDKKIYAGNKGIGRFSCDRLGKKLDLYTTANGKDGWHLIINWEDFEKDGINIELGSIPVKLQSCSQEKLLEVFECADIQSGTLLVISNLRRTWDVDDLKKLRTELEKFTVSSTIDNNTFDVCINVYGVDKWNANLNGIVQNKIFESLTLRTPSVHSRIDEKGVYIETTLKLDGRDIFTLKEKNTFSLLKDIEITIYYLNKPSKVFFNRITGYRSVDFGSIFLFLNGFRIFPYGEPDDDWLGLDKRKNQGYGRYFGTRELVGYIKINDKENAFLPVSAREGIAKNDAFIQLTNMVGNKQYKDPGYFYKIMRKLEKFVVDGLDWYKVVGDEDGNIIPESFFKDKQPDNVDYIPKDKEILEALASVINIQTLKNDVVDLKINNEFISELALKEKSAFNALKQDLLNKFAREKINSDFLSLNADALTTVIKQQSQINENLKKENSFLKNEISIHKYEIKAKQEEIKEKEKVIERTEGENLFLRATSNQDTDSLLKLMHKIIDDAEIMKRKLDNFIRKKRDNALTEQYIDEFINLMASKVSSISKVASFATYRNYKMATGLKEIDIIKFIKDYIRLLQEEKVHDGDIELIDELSSELSLLKKIRPLNLSIMVDNIINNSKKARSDKLRIYSKKDESEKSINIYFEDYGRIIDKNENLAKFFDKGYTTTNGSGLGLYQLKQFVSEELKGKALAQANEPKGLIIELEIPCN